MEQGFVSSLNFSHNPLSSEKVETPYETTLESRLEDGDTDSSWFVQCSMSLRYLQCFCTLCL